MRRWWPTNDKPEEPTCSHGAREGRCPACRERERAESLRTALMRYGQHRHRCAVWRGERTCDCGLREALQ